jgi:hypothetical protein
LVTPQDQEAMRKKARRRNKATRELLERFNKGKPSEPDSSEWGDANEGFSN